MNITALIMLIPIVAIIAWAAVEVSKNIGARGSANAEHTADLLAEVSGRLDMTHDENTRLRARIEALEAIVANEADSTHVPSI